MKIKTEFKFSNNGYQVETYTPETPIDQLSERAIAYGVKIGAIVKAPENKAKKAPLSKRAK